MSIKKTFIKELDKIDSRKDEMINTLIKWSNINSGSYNLEGIRNYRNILELEFKKLLNNNDILEKVSLPPFEDIDNHGDIIKKRVSKGLLIKKRPNIKNRILLCGHMDTVFSKNHSFQSCKLIDSNTLNGPGVADMKGGILAMLVALQSLESSSYCENIGWDVYLSPDEEIGSLSSSSIFPQFSNHRFGMIYEPSLPNGEFVGKRKGSGNFTIVVKGKSSHAGRAFYKGKSAIIKLSKIVSELWGLNNPSHTTTLNVGLINGGQALNVVPELAIARFNIRFSNDKDANEALAKVDAILDNHSEKDYKIFRHGKLSRSAKNMDKKQEELFNELRKINNEIDIDTKVIETGGCCDGNNLKELGLPNIDTLGVRGGMIHSDKEFMLVDSLPERAKLSALILLAFASGYILQS